MQILLRNEWKLSINIMQIVAASLHIQLFL